MMKSFRPPHFSTSGYFARFANHLRTLSPGDKAVALVLSAVLFVLIFLGLYAIERQFLVEVPTYGGGLTEGEVGAPRFVNPLLALSDADRDLTALTYAGLMGYNALGDLTPVLADHYTVSEDGKIYTFVLRSNLKFTDGTPVTSDDVVYTVGKAQDPALKSPEMANWANIRAEAVDSRTVRFTLPKAYAPFLEDATLGILPAHLWRGLEDEEFPFSPLVQQPVAAGPFRVAHIARDKNGVIKEYNLRQNDGYALGRPFLSSFNFVFFKDASELSDALMRGRVESAYGVNAPGALRAPYSRVFGAFLNPTKNALFARSEVRKALSLAIDRDALVKNVLGGYGTPLWGPVPPGSGADIAAPSVPADTIGAASALLADSGWKYDADAHAWKLASKGKDTLTLSFTLTTANVPELKALAEAVKSDWEKLGVPVSIEYYDPSDLASEVIRPRNYDALLFGMVVGRDRDLYAFWDSSQRADPGLNIALYANKSADALLESLRVEQDPAKTQSDLSKLDALIAADYPAVFLEAPDFLYAVPKDLRGVALSRISSPTDRLVSAASWYRGTQWIWPALENLGGTRQ